MNKLLKRIIVFSFFILLLFPQSSQAGFEFPNPLENIEDLPDFLKVLWKIIFDLAIVLAPLLIVYAGFLFVTAAGNPDTIKKAKDVITWTIVGLVIILISGGIASVIKDVLKQGSSPIGP